MWRSRLFWQLFASAALLVLGALGLVGFLLARQIQQNERRDIETSLHEKASLLQAFVRDRDPDSIEKLVALPGGHSMRVTLIAGDGRVLAETAATAEPLDNHGDRPEVRAALREGYGKAVRHSNTLGRDMMYVAVRAEGGAGPVAVVRVALPLARIDEHLARLLHVVWLAVGVTALLALLLAFALTRRLVGAVAELTEGAQKIAAGNYGQRIYPDTYNELGQLATAFNDMSARLTQQFDRMEEDRQQLRAVLSSMVEGVVAIDAEQRILFANERACQLLEFPLPSALGRRLWEVIWQRPLQEVLRGAMTDDAVRSHELTWSGPGARSLSVNVARLPGEPTRGAVLVFHDTTELRRLERLRQDFVANVSHELKTPLAIIQACIETLIDGAIDDAAHRGPFLTRIDDETQRLHHLILDLLQLSRLESEAVAFTKEILDVEAIVRDCLDRHRTLAAGKGQTLEALPPADGSGALNLWADEESVQQILDNLVNNALKYTPAGGTVRVRWDRLDDRVLLEVEDTGIGIPEADLPRVFERFYRVDKARARELGSTGLGLSIVKHLTQALQGSVRAVSVVGKGSTFRVLLPRVQKP